MPRGGKGGHKGQRRHFTSPEELEHQRQREKREREWRKQRGDSESDEDASSEEESSSSEDEESTKPKGASSVIDVENPNRAVQKHKKAAALTLENSPTQKSELSRRDREELMKQKAQAHYQKLHAEGKTEEARADMARLAIIKKQREEAAKKREEEKKTKEDALKAKRETTQKALGKKKS